MNKRIILLVFSLVFITEYCFANVPLVTAFGFGLPFYMAVVTFGISFLVIAALEGIAIHFLAKFSWKRALLVSVTINLISTFAGGIIYGFFPTPLVTARGAYLAFALVMSLVFGIGFFILLFVFYLKKKLLLLFLSLLMVISVFLMILFGSPLWPQFSRVFIVSLIPAFGVTAILEGALLYRAVKKREAFRIVVLANLLSYLFILVVLLFNPARYNNPLVTTDYYMLAAQGAAKRGDIPLAKEMIKKYRSIEMEVIEKNKLDYYFPGAEQRVIKIWMEKKQYKEAEELIRDTLALDVDLSGWGENLEKELKKVRELRAK